MSNEYLILTKRPFFDRWETDDRQALKAQENCEWIPYVRFVVAYTKFGKPISILPWTQEAHNHIMGPHRKFCANPEDYPNPPREVYYYCQLRDKHYRDLAGAHYAKKVKEYGEEYEKMVKGLGGAVDPAVLMSKCSDLKVILYAKILHYIRENMKDQRKVYFSMEELPFLQNPKYQRFIRELIDCDAITWYASKFALTWAHQQVMDSMLEDDPKFTHNAKAIVKACASWDEETGGTEFDFDRAVDGFVNKGFVAVTMIHPPIKEIFSYPRLTRIERTWEEFRSDLKVKVDSLVDRILFVSNTGDVCIQPHGWILVKVTTALLRPFQLGDVCFMCPSRGSYDLKYRNKTRYGVPLSTVCEYIQPAACCLYTDMLKISSGTYDSVILIGNPEPKWEREAIKITGNDDTRCIVFNFKKKGTPPPPLSSLSSS